MEIDPSQSESVRQKSEALIALSNGPLSSSISKLTESSRVLPSEKDFHFYYNFDEFRAPIDEIGAKSGSILEKIGSSSRLWGGKELGFPKNAEEDGCDWLIDVNDNVFERIDKSIEEEANSRVRVEESNGLVVSGKKKVLEKEGSVGSTIGVRVAERDKKTVGPKSKIPFHIASIKRPQDEYNILVNNGNQPFQHVWLERSEDGSRVIHPLEKVSFMDFVDRNIESLDPVKPPPLESTPFKLVEEVKDLKDLAAKLRNVNEFAVDLEHNQYRSFQGLTCLMQISTRTEDFVVDTLKLRIHIGPYLREVFKDPNKRKVMHGADRDIAWLQRDFGIYVCNLFDTGQASRVLQMERYSLEHLLQHFCEVAANKQYQNADWRLRPLPEEMMRYAREDTHYLLHIYDLMKIRLLSESTDPKNSDALLLEVYKRSYDVCIQLYEKELLTDTSYLHIYGVQGANLNAQQLSIVAGLYEWRDTVARAEDESTGYVLPNKTLLEIAKQMPLTTNKLRRILKSKLPFVDRNLAAVVGIIRHSVQNASAFETVAQKLKEDNIQGVPEVNDAAADFPEARTAGSHSGDCSDESQFESEQGSFLIKKGNYKHMGNDSTKSRGGFSFEFGKNGNLTKNLISDPRRLCTPFLSQRNEINAVGATVKLLRKPNCAFGALLGSSASKKTNDLTKEKGENQLEQIRSSVNLPFRSFSHTDQQSKQPFKPTPEQQNRASDASFSGAHPGAPALATDSEDIILLESDQPLNNRCEGQVDAAPASSTKSEDVVILLDSDSSDDEVPDSSADDNNNDENMTDHREMSAEPELVILDDDDDDDDDEPMSLSDLSSSFQKCLQPTNRNQSQTMKDNGESEETITLKFKQVDNGVEDDEVEFVE